LDIRAGVQVRKAGEVSGEFWIGFIYGGLATALPLLGYMVWDANRRVQERLRSEKEAA
jgi:hypothetical protein